MAKTKEKERDMVAEKKIMDILLDYVGWPLTVGEITEKTGLSKSTVYQILGRKSKKSTKTFKGITDFVIWYKGKYRTSPWS